jgi:hypothetical protein
MLEKEDTLNLLTEVKNHIYIYLKPAHIKDERDTILRTLEILRKAQNILKRDTDISKF